MDSEIKDNLTDPDNGGDVHLTGAISSNEINKSDSNPKGSERHNINFEGNEMETCDDTNTNTDVLTIPLEEKGKEMALVPASASGDTDEKSSALQFVAVDITTEAVESDSCDVTDQAANEDIGSSVSKTTEVNDNIEDNITVSVPNTLNDVLGNNDIVIKKTVNNTDVSKSDNMNSSEQIKTENNTSIVDSCKISESEGNSTLSFSDLKSKIKDRDSLSTSVTQDETAEGKDCPTICVDIGDKKVVIKEEARDLGYERPEHIYRECSIVVYSDSDTSSPKLSPDAGFSDGGAVTDDEEIENRLNARKIALMKSKSRTEGEVFPEELPPLEYLTIAPDEGVELEPLGAVSGIVDVLVVVKADQDRPALYDDSILFLESRQPLGLIFETFGTVERPYYSIRFNSNKDIVDRGISVGNRVMFAPRADNLTKYVFIAELRKIKCDDASWENDNEPPPSHRDFSDDEEERRAKQRQRNKDRGPGPDAGTAIDARKKKRRKKPNIDRQQESQGPRLLQGDLNKNPFGDGDQMFNPPSSNQWPPKKAQNFNNKNQSNFGSQTRFRYQPPNQMQGFRKPWTPPANFGESPVWQGKPGLLGQPPTSGYGPSYGFQGGSNPFNSTNQFGPPPPPGPFGGNLMYPQPPSSQHGGPYFPMGSVPPFRQQPPPGNHNQHGPPSHMGGFSMFNPSQPPPSVRPMFTTPPLPPSSS